MFFDGAWRIRDLSSKNGTILNGVPVQGCATVEESAVLRFGSEGDEWRLTEAGAPTARAISSQGVQVDLGALSLLPPGKVDTEAYLSCEGGEWFLECDGKIRAVKDGETIQLKTDAWRLELPLGEHADQAQTSLVGGVSVGMRFKVNPSEEHVELALVLGGRRHVFAHRTYFYLLLLLARERLSDQRAGRLPSTECGWLQTNDLAGMLKTTAEQINVWIWRIRKHLQQIDVELSQRVVERRPTLGQLRIGVEDLRVDEH